MPNMTEKKTNIPEQRPEERKKNYLEVALGYQWFQAKEEAERCLQCKNKPCVSGCPVNVQIPEFIKLIREEKVEDAYKKILETNSMPAVCGRVCPQENQCEKYCVRGIKGEPVGIGRLERFAADNGNHCKGESEKCKVNDINNTQAKVAVVGSGPAGLTCAGDLAKMGYPVTLYEAFHTLGGVLVYGIPEFRLPKKIVKDEIEYIKSLGVNVETNVVIGRTLNIDDLFEMGFKAVFIGSGAGLPMFMKIPGENLNGVMSANEFLTRINLMKAYKFPNAHTPVWVGKKVAVVGGGNVAMDSARCALRMGAETVSIIYRRSKDEMPARREELHHAEEEGIEFSFLTNPIEITGDEKGWVNGIKCMAMELGETDQTGRRSSKEIPGSEFIVDVDTVIMAIGTNPNPIITDTTEGLEKTKKGGVQAEKDSGKTSKEGVFAGGDIVTGAATVIQAMGAGKKAAKAIDEYIRSK